MKKFILIVVMMICMVSTSYAGTLRLGSGGPTGNYFAMSNDIADYCAEDLAKEGVDIEVVQSSGSVENLNGLITKKYSIAWVQADVLMNMAKTNPQNINQNRIKIIAGMHPESIHLLVPKDYNPGSGGFMNKLGNLFGSDAPKMDINLLKGQRIASWGGSVVSAKALSYFFDLGMEVVDVPENMRNAKSIDMPVLLVGGHPYKPVQSLLESGKFILLALDYDAIKARAPFYVKTEVSYKIGPKVSVTPTVGVQALLLGKAFKRDSKNKVMSVLATSIDNNLMDLADDPDTNPNWATVYDLNQNGVSMPWEYFKIIEGE